MGVFMLQLLEYEPHKSTRALLSTAPGMAREMEILMHPHITTDSSTPKLCECGCGLPAPIAKQSNTKLGHIKGQPFRFIAGHHRKATVSPPNPSGLCQCGCGQKTPLATRNHTLYGHAKGHPIRFVYGHGYAVNSFVPFIEPVVQPGTRAIRLSKGKFAIVDAADYEWLSQWKWSLHKVQNAQLLFYAKSRYVSGNGKVIQMHRFILNAPDGSIVDHIDGDGLNNTRANLRFASSFQNSFNRRKGISNTSGYKGVTWNKKCQKWQVQIEANGKCYYLGVFDDVEDAARAYDAAAILHHGEFAYLNFQVTS